MPQPPFAKNGQDEESATGTHKVLSLLLIFVILALMFIISFQLLIQLTIPPDIIQVVEIPGNKTSEGMIIHLDENNFHEYPVLENVLMEGESKVSEKAPYEGFHIIGEVEYPDKITQETIDTYKIDSESGKWKYFEYEGRFYSILTMHCD